MRCRLAGKVGFFRDLRATLSPRLFPLVWAAAGKGPTPLEWGDFPYWHMTDMSLWFIQPVDPH